MVRKNLGDLWARERCPLTRVSSWLQGVPGNNGLPGQPGLTAELVGTGLDSLSCAPPALPRTELAMLAPLAAVGVPPPSVFRGWEKPGSHVASRGSTWCRKSPSPFRSPSEPSCLSLAGILAH